MARGTDIMIMLKSIPIIWLLLSICLAGPASADDRADKTKAKALFDEAQVHYQVGRFEEAEKDYSKAYELARLPGFLFNIGQCHRELKDYARALSFYESYLEKKPDAKNRGIVEGLIAEAKGKIADQEEQKRRNEEIALKLKAERLAEAKSSLGSNKSPRDLTQPVPNPPGQNAATPSNILAASEPSKAKERVPLYEKWWFWTIVGSAVAVAAGTTIYAVSSGGKDEMPAGTIGTVDFR